LRAGEQTSQACTMASSTLRCCHARWDRYRSQNLSPAVLEAGGCTEQCPAVCERAVSADEFLRRFLLHVLPKGLIRIRHFGLFANRKMYCLSPTSTSSSPCRMNSLPSCCRTNGYSMICCFELQRARAFPWHRGQCLFLHVVGDGLIAALAASIAMTAQGGSATADFLQALLSSRW